jgi:transposase
VSSMGKEQVRRQAVPDAMHGVVIGIDISKGWIDWRACRPGEWGRRHHTAQSREGFLRLERELQTRTERGEEVWVGAEPTGSYGLCLQEWLLGHGRRVVLVNPYHVHRTKEISDNSPRKDDEKDPGVIADLVWGAHYYRPRSVQGPYAELRAGIGEWSSLARKRTAARNEAQALLEVWFPELVRSFKDPLCLTGQALIRHYDSPQALAKAPLRSVQQELAKATHGRCRRFAQQMQEAAAVSVALAEGQQSRVRALRTLLDELTCIEARQERLREELAGWLAQTREGQYLLSVPRMKVILVGGLLGECGPLADFARYAELEKFVGLHLFRLTSGQRRGRFHVAKRGRSGARALLGTLAALHVQEGGLCHAWAQELRARGKKPLEIQMAVARKLLRMLHALSRQERFFDSQRWHAGSETADDEPVH